MSKKIVIIGNNSGGTYGFRRELIGELIERGCSITVLTPFDTRVDELIKLGVQLVNTPLNRRGISPKEDFTLFRRYRQLLKDLRPDLVITYTIKPNVYGGLACRMAHIPYAVNITGLGTAFQHHGMLRKTVTQMYKIGCKKANVVFFENAENRQIFINEHIVREEKTCLLNGAGVNLKHFQLAAYPTDDSPTRFLFIGRVMREKGIDELFVAMKKLISDGIACHLDVVGGFDEDYSATIAAHEKEGWLKYWGYQEDIRPFIARDHCFVLPSWHEGMANTNLECAASGRPVITTNIHGCMESVEDGISGFLCKKKDSASLYMQMRRFCSLDHEARCLMGIKGHKRMENMFDKRKVVAETIARLPM